MTSIHNAITVILMLEVFQLTHIGYKVIIGAYLLNFLLAFTWEVIKQVIIKAYKQ